ncbi:MAG: EAL domain-containing protein [Gammaproteobacteria bacterium]|nr:MAG: EAL domain-containing protein [Gammaproteobacteria bacterium]
MRLQNKILLLLIPLAILPILALGWSSYVKTMEDEHKQSRQQMSSLLEQIRVNTVSQMRTARANASLFANSELVERFAHGGMSAELKDELAPAILEMLFNYQLSYPEYYEIRIVSPEGKEKLRSALGDVGNVTTDESMTPYFRETRNHPGIIYTTFFRNPDNNQPALLASKPLQYRDSTSSLQDTQKKIFGYLMLTVKLSFLEKLARNEKIGDYGHVFFTDASGTILFHHSESEVGTQLPPDLFQKLISEVSPDSTVTGKYNSKTAYFQGKKLHDWLYAIAFYPEHELISKHSNLGWSVALFTFIAILFISMFIFSALRMLLIRPIQQLRHAASEMGRGNVLVPIDVKSNDEIGDLATSFRQMGKNLHHYHEQVRYIAYHDSLTGLPNRKMFKDYLTRSAAEARRNLHELAILFLDLDNFKRINDTLGHQAGDKLLKALADRLSNCLRETDVLSHPARDNPGELMARLAGDEFIILLPKTRGPDDAQKVARRVLNSLTEPFIIDKQELYISTSIGIAMYPTDGKDSNELLKSADIAMYSAKKLGRNNYQYYSEEMNKEAVRKLKIENRLRRAVENRELELYFQPQMNISTGQIIGVESLLRWRDAKLGQVSPEVFIPIAEEYGLIVPISKWVIHEACRQAREWQDTYDDPITMSINISAVHFNGNDLENVIAKSLRDTGLDPQYLELELTETSILQDPELAINTLTGFKRMGLRVSLDDFGTGYSSLSYLMKLPLDKLKIDKSFIQTMKSGTRGASIVSAIIAMAHSLDLSVIAEGVENDKHLQLLRQMHCDMVQGYHIARPMPASQFEEMFANTLKRRA